MSKETMKTPGPGSSCKIGAGSGGKEAWGYKDKFPGL